MSFLQQVHSSDCASRYGHSCDCSPSSLASFDLPSDVTDVIPYDLRTKETMLEVARAYKEIAKVKATAAAHQEAVRALANAIAARAQFLPRGADISFGTTSTLSDCWFDDRRVRISTTGYIKIR